MRWILAFILIIPLATASTQYTQDYNNFLTRSVADYLYCMLNNNCTLDIALTTNTTADVFCLTGDDCITAWPIVGGSGGYDESAYLSIQGRARFGYDGIRGAVEISDKTSGGSSATKHIVFDTDDLERMRIDKDSGYVGIGDTDPSYTLSVDGTASNRR